MRATGTAARHSKERKKTKKARTGSRRQQAGAASKGQLKESWKQGEEGEEEDVVGGTLNA